MPIRLRLRPSSPPPLTFGIYPSGASATDPVTPDDPACVQDALARLQGTPGRSLRIRAYAEYHDAACDLTGRHLTPREPEQYLGAGRRLDLVAQFQATSGNVDGYQTFVRHLVARYGRWIDLLQVTEEANVTGGYGLDGDFPKVHEALVAGVLAAKQEARHLGLAHLRVGFNVATTEDADPFFRTLGRLGGQEWAAAVDYVGLDCYPDVWDHPVAPDGQPGDIGEAMMEAVRWLRQELPAAGLPARLPIVVAEHGWPTGPGRTPERQAVVLERVVRTLSRHRGDLNVAGYALFALRDADSASPDPFDQLGIVRDDHTPKPAFEVYRRLIAELGAPTTAAPCPSLALSCVPQRRSFGLIRRSGPVQTGEQGMPGPSNAAGKEPR